MIIKIKVKPRWENNKQNNAQLEAKESLNG